jgi:hypothetical protein
MDCLGVQFTEERKKSFVEMLRKGMRRGAVCEAIGVSRACFHTHLKDDQAFREQVNDAELEARHNKNEIVKDKLFERAAIDGDFSSMRFYLTNHCPDEYVDSSKVNVHQKTEGKTEFQLRWSGDLFERIENYTEYLEGLERTEEEGQLPPRKRDGLSRVGLASSKSW